MQALRPDGARALYDLAGEQLGDGRLIAAGRLLRSGHPGPIDPTLATQLRRYAGTVVDLRSPREVTKLPGPLTGEPDVRVHEVSIGGDATRPGFGYCDSLLRLYPLLLEHYATQVRTVVELVANAYSGALVHCQTGRDRTGLAVGVTLRLAGVPDDTIITRQRQVAELLADHVAQRRLRWQAKGRDVAVFDAVNRHSDAALRAAFAWIDQRHGDTARYLAAHGAPPDLRARLTTTLTTPTGPVQEARCER